LGEQAPQESITMASVFISYSRSSLEMVKSLGDDLAALGHVVWFDQALTGGQRWWDTILDRIRASDIFACALSPESLDSTACGHELRYAAALGKPVLPIIVSDGVNPKLLPNPLAEIQLVDYRQPDKAAAFALMRAIASLPPTPPMPDPLPESPPAPLSYLGNLRQRIDSPDLLAFQEQIALVIELKDYLREHGDAARPEVTELLGRLTQRRDLLARVAQEIDAVLLPDDARAPAGPRVERPQPVSRGAAEPEPCDRSETRRERTRPPQPLGGSSNGNGRVPRSVATGDAVPALAEVLRRVLERGESWKLETDPHNYVVLTRGGESPRRTVAASAALRDNMLDGKSKAFKAIGWSVKDGAFGKGMGAGAVMYATGGLGALALLSKSVRDYMMTHTATRTWTLRHAAGDLLAVAEDLQRALEVLGANDTRVAFSRQDPRA
jgi:hypothetical protein